MDELTAEELAEQVRLTREIMAELRAEEAARKAAIKAAKDAANWAAARDLDAHLPCQVQVVAHDTDEAWETAKVDLGRVGWVRVPSSQATDQQGESRVCTYVEDMDPDDGREGDRNPTRYHEPRHIRRLP